MMPVLITKEMSYLVVGLFDNLVGLSFVYMCGIKFLATLFALIRP